MMLQKYYFIFDYQNIFYFSFGELADIHSANWRISVRQISGILFGKLARVYCIFDMVTHTSYTLAPFSRLPQFTH